MSAQGNALGAQQQKNAPCKGKSIIIRRRGRGILVFFASLTLARLKFAALVIGLLPALTWALSQPFFPDVVQMAPLLFGEWEGRFLECFFLS